MQQQQYGPGGAPPHGGYAYGPQQPPAYAVPLYGPSGVHPAQLADLNNQATVWLVVGIAGFWLGAGFVTGPLAWIYASKLRDRYRLLGFAPSSSASGAWAVGIATTIVSWLAIVAVALVLSFVFGSLAMF